MDSDDSTEQNIGFRHGSSLKADDSRGEQMLASAAKKVRSSKSSAQLSEKSMISKQMETMNQSGAAPELASTAPGYKADECANSIRTGDLHQLLNRASVAAWTKHIEELGAICVRDIAELRALAFRFINLKHVATDEQFADVFTKAPTAPMLRLLKALMDGAAKLPLLARLYM